MLNNIGHESGPEEPLRGDRHCHVPLLLDVGLQAVQVVLHGPQLATVLPHLGAVLHRLVG